MKWDRRHKWRHIWIKKSRGCPGWNIMLWGRRLSVCSLIISVVPCTTDIIREQTQRLFSNNICSAWDYDKAGRPIFHEVSNQRSKADAAHQGIFGNVVGWSDTLRRHRYEWDVNYQLKEYILWREGK